MTPEEVDEAVTRVLSSMRQYVLLKRELDWYQVHEPLVYAKLREQIKGAILGAC